MKKQNRKIIEKKAILWETYSIEKIFEQVNSSTKGLSSQFAQERITQHGKNKLPEVKRKNPVVRFLLQFNNALIYVLIGAGILKLIMALTMPNGGEHFIDMGVIFGVIIINSLIGFIQEGKAQKALDAIKNMLSLKCVVIRDGVRIEIDAEELTIGDVVFIRSGDKIPADLRLFSISNLEIDESALTGESVAVSKNIEAVAKDTPLGERVCMAYASTNVTSGDGLGVVVEVGSNTEIGKINEMLVEAKAGQSPLMKKIDKFGKILSLIILGVAVVMLPIAIFGWGLAWYDAVTAVIGLAVAAVPEGLPSIITIILALGVGRMAYKKAIVKKLPSVETLGSVTVICSDKTGTLTKNEMTATNIYTTFGDFEIMGAGYSSYGEIKKGSQTFGLENTNLAKLIQCAGFCNEASVNEIDGQFVPSGNPTEASLITLSKKVNLFDTFNAKKIADIPFDSSYKYRATAVEVNSQNSKLNAQLNTEKLVFVSGACEKVLELCKFQASENSQEKIDINFWENKINSIASSGKRMIGLAYADVVGVSPHDIKTELNHEGLKTSNLIFLGIVGIIDPPKPEAIEAIKIARKAGITVKMITGDHALTAGEIARQMSLTDNQSVLSGSNLENMSDEELQKAVAKCDIFARTSPEHKLRLVRALQANGEVVSMTGDGVNDAPSLKSADIGVAMGIKGTDVTKDSADMVLADDNFATIIAAVKEGRTTYDNIIKTIIFLLPTSTAQAFVIITALLLNFTLPITALQILWVNMVVAVTISIAFAFEESESSVMNRKPRPPNEGIVGKYTLFRTAYTVILHTALAVGSFLILYESGMYGEDLAHARTFAVNMLVVAGSIFYVFNCRKTNSSMFSKDFFKNKIAFIVCGILLLLQIAFTYIPFMNNLFGTAFLTVIDWLIIIGIGIAFMLIVELEKFITRKFIKINS
ncbi:MAG: HAD-IC family P-type ATPase [Firmicutes bacterium]|nr:HAD-IC family P-type ATPase [Bacillota bacterium]